MVSKKEFSSDIRHYLQYDLATYIFNLAKEQYELPRMNRAELWEVQQAYVDISPRFGDILTKDDASFKRFKKALVAEFGGSGDEGALQAITMASDCNFFSYSKTAPVKNEKIAKALGPQLAAWVESAALFIEEQLEAVREATKQKELQELERLAKKHGRTLS